SPEKNLINIDFFEGSNTPPFKWKIEIKENDMNTLKDRIFRMKTGATERRIRFNNDATIRPPYFPGAGQYWFIRNRAGSSLLTICSEGQILQEFKKTQVGSWNSVQRLEFAMANASAGGHL